MREILFRGKGIVTGKWVYGVPVPVEINSYMTERIEMVECHSYDELDYWNLTSYHREVDPKTVGQWTGLVDKNGVKIFEGDVLDTPRWVVTYKADTREGYGMNAGWYIQRDDFESWTELENVKDHVVLGNIHDNPELLEKWR